MMRNSFEGESLESIDIDRMHDKAEKAIEASRIMETEEADIAKVAELEAKFAHNRQESGEMKKVADIFEAVVLEHGELSNWFGENASTQKTSRFDDYTNGVDLLVEFTSEGSEEVEHLGLAADVTFTADTTKKFDRLRENIRLGKLVEVKYHAEDLGDGPIGVPEVIIGAEKKTVMELAELWIERRNKELANHRIQIMMLRQIEAQLETFALYARSIGKDDVALVYEGRLGTIKDLLAQKAEIERQVRFELSGDTVHEAIMSFLSRWKRDMSMQKAA